MLVHRHRRPLFQSQVTSLWKAWIRGSHCHSAFFFFFFQMEQSETHLLYLFFLVSYLLLLICHFVYSRKKKGGGTGHKGGIKVKSSILIRANKTKKWGNYFQNKQLPFASQLKNNKSQKWPVAEHLNTHINHKNSYTAPWQCIATVQNFSQGERRQKNTLLLLTPASHFGLQRF